MQYARQGYPPVNLHHAFYRISILHTVRVHLFVYICAGIEDVDTRLHTRSFALIFKHLFYINSTATTTNWQMLNCLYKIHMN